MHCRSGEVQLPATLCNSHAPPAPEVAGVAWMLRTVAGGCASPAVVRGLRVTCARRRALLGMIPKVA